MGDEEFGQISRVIRDTEGMGFWPKQLDRILAKTGLYEDKDRSLGSSLVKQRAQRSLTKSLVKGRIFVTMSLPCSKPFSNSLLLRK